MEMSCWIYCITSTTVFSRQIVLNTTVSFFHHFIVMACYYFYVFQKKQKNKRPEVFTDLMVAETINISLSSASSK